MPTLTVTTDELVLALRALRGRGGLQPRRAEARNRPARCGGRCRLRRFLRSMRRPGVTSALRQTT